MKSVVAFPGTMEHAQQIALALHERGALERYVTTFAYRDAGALGALARHVPALQAQLARRSLDLVPPERVSAYPAWEIIRTLAQKARVSETNVDRLWDILSHRFDAIVARDHVPEADAIHAFEYTALASFRRAGETGARRVLHLPALNNVYARDILQQERAEWIALRRDDDRYFDEKFLRRQDRRDAEAALADIVFVNSRLTARSHAAHGVDERKIVVAPLGAPPPDVSVNARDINAPLSVLWVGGFSLQKGGHYLAQAWRMLGVRDHARLDIFGRATLAPTLFCNSDRVLFHGSVPRSSLKAIYRSADVLVFPSLADGFGMVVGEALASGLPVIVSDMAGAADIVDPSCGFVIPARSAQAIVESLQWCLDNRATLQAMRLCALRAAARRQWVDFRRDIAASLECPLEQGDAHRQGLPCASAS
ncbi:MAG: glycosyltransferase family 4 protein [Hyphomicrobiales bacterium]|nr:glycosyltransferase family 4 protein [Hyphomicrobiales bacterium]